MQHYRPEVYEARGSVGYLLKRAHLLMLDQLESVVAGSDITITQWVVMMYLRDGLAINARDLCSQLRHDSGALTRLIDQLEARALVQRERSREDRREVQLRLTDAGRETTYRTLGDGTRILCALVFGREEGHVRKTEVVNFPQRARSGGYCVEEK